MSKNNLDETLDYELVVKPPINASPNGNGNGVYAIVNKQTNVTEAEVPFLVQGYEGLYEMQASLDNWRDKFDQKKKEKEKDSEILVN